MIWEEGTNNVRLLTIEYQGTSFFEEKLIFRESSYDIVKLLANKNQLFIMNRNGSEYNLKCFKLAPNLDLIHTGAINNIEEHSPGFIDEFE